MFIGAVPTQVISQVLATVPFDKWGDVYVGCSGSFRFDRAVKKRFPDCRVYSNDVSLLTCSIGALATGRSFSMRFARDLQFVEELMRDADFPTRVAAVMVAAAMGKFTANNEYARAHFNHYRTQFLKFVEEAGPKLDALVKETVIADFFPGDFQMQADRAEKSGGGVACFAPTYKGGYERIYRLINDNVDWPAPEYGIWNPNSLPAFVQGLEERKIAYCVISDNLLDGRSPTTEWRGSNKPVYTYSNEAQTSLRRRKTKEQQFKYTPAVPSDITADSRIHVSLVDNKRITYLKNVYLSKGIDHTAGHINHLVYIDGKLVGGFSFEQSRFGDKTRELYLLSDFSLFRERKLSKLIAMVATSKDVINPINRRLIIRVERIVTTAFTTQPVSMKYRGVFELKQRTADHLQYHSGVRDQSLQEVFDEWYRKHAGTVGKQDRIEKAARSETA